MLFITGSKEKTAEVSRMLDVEQHPLDLDEIQSLDPKEIIRYKMEQAKKHLSEPFIIEDTSFYIGALDGFPGPLIKWWNKTAGPIKIGELFTGSKAYSETTFGYFDGQHEHFFTGRLDGTIVKHRTTEGYGFDIVFQPDGFDKTLAEMTADEKNRISHRGRALAKLVEYLKEKKMSLQ